ncbi:MAG: hypothetical protein BWK79_05855 [Beggiatoa sp. IS2]|nr:MAG: hypothetical protein BWK79_05855 [Beggiatoa sp. IS2]
MNFKIISDLYPYLKSFRHWLLPQSCFLCGDANPQTICSYCLESLPYQKTACQHCARSLPKNGVCGKCLQRPPPYQRTQVVFSYDYPVNKLILAMKFNDNLALLKLSGHLMAQRLDLEPRPDVLIPVPLHPKRLRQRGYNQSLELAKMIAKQTGIPLNYTACKRIRNTPQQTRLTAEQRETNVRGAFQVQFVKPEWQHLVIIDDVMTTGATVTELANMFLNAGIRRVDVWCCARRNFS